MFVFIVVCIVSWKTKFHFVISGQYKTIKKLKFQGRNWDKNKKRTRWCVSLLLQAKYSMTLMPSRQFNTRNQFIPYFAYNDKHIFHYGSH